MPIPATLRDLLILSAQNLSVDNCIISLTGILCKYYFFFHCNVNYQNVLMLLQSPCNAGSMKEFPKQRIFLNCGYFWNLEFSSLLGF